MSAKFPPRFPSVINSILPPALFHPIVTMPTFKQSSSDDLEDEKTASPLAYPPNLLGDENQTAAVVDGPVILAKSRGVIKVREKATAILLIEPSLIHRQIDGAPRFTPQHALPDPPLWLLCPSRLHHGAW